MKIFYRISIIILLVFIFFITYLSLVGFETKKFNNQITQKIKDIDSNLDLELKKIKIILNPLELTFNVKTIGPKLKVKDKVLGIENIKTQIQLTSLFKKDLKVENLNISTKSIKIANLISFVRIIHQKPELYILEKVIKKGFLIADIKLNFDSKGNIKQDFKINGFVKDLDLSIFNKNEVKKIDFYFDLKKNYFQFENINFKFNDLNLSSQNLIVENKNEEYDIRGEIQNKSLSLNKKNIELLVNPYLSFLNIKLASNNKFSFKINKKFQLKDFELESNVKIDNASLLNKFNLKSFFPQIKKNIDITDHNLQINYSKNNFDINGKGNVLLQNNLDKIIYSIKKKDKRYNFETSIDFNKNPFVLEFLNYKQKKPSQAKIKFKGVNADNKTKFELISIQDKDIKLNIKDLKLNNKLQVIDLRSADIDYFDSENKNNKFRIKKNKNIFLLKSASFNAEQLIENLLKSDKKKNNLIDADFELNIDIDQLYLDKIYKLKNFKGSLFFNNDKITNGNLIGLFPDNKKFQFTVNSDGNEKITTLFTEKAKPLVNKYKFIKGFKGGSLDFYSTKMGSNSISTIKIYNFKLNELPFLTKILTLASLQGIADLLSGEGITFNEFEMNFNSNQNLMKINEIYAIGPSISILMDGYVEKNKLISLRGTLVPATTLNKVIGSIPFLGKILVGSKTGEGVFGVSFKIKGDLKNPETTVNPIKTLTPRFITRTLEKINKTN